MSRSLPSCRRQSQHRALHGHHALCMFCRRWATTSCRKLTAPTLTSSMSALRPNYTHALRCRCTACLNACLSAAVRTTEAWHQSDGRRITKVPRPGEPDHGAVLTMNSCGSWYRASRVISYTASSPLRHSPECVAMNPCVALVRPRCRKENAQDRALGRGNEDAWPALQGPQAGESQADHHY